MLRCRNGSSRERQQCAALVGRSVTCIFQRLRVFSVHLRARRPSIERYCPSLYVPAEVARPASSRSSDRSAQPSSGAPSGCQTRSAPSRSTGPITVPFERTVSVRCARAHGSVLAKEAPAQSSSGPSAKSQSTSGCLRSVRI